MSGSALWEILSRSCPAAASPSRFAWSQYIRALVREIQRRWDAELPDDSELHGDTGMEIVAWLIAAADQAEVKEGTVATASAPKLLSPVSSQPVAITVDRYLLGDAIWRAWLERGQDSWLTIADDVIAELGAEAGE